MAFLRSGNVVVSVSIDLQLITILVLIVRAFLIIWEMFHGRISLNSVHLLLPVTFVSGFWLGLMYVSPWFSAACAASIAHRNHFFRLYQHKKSSESKVKYRLVIVTKGFLKLPNLHMLIKQKSSSLHRSLALGTFDELLTLFSRKVNLLYLLYLTTI